MKLSTKFNVGDKAYIIRKKSESYHDTCPACGGTGKLHIKETGDEIKCTVCHGNGYKVGFESSIYKEQCHINKISIITEADETKIIYDLLLDDGRTVQVPEDYVYTLKAADKCISDGSDSAVYRQFEYLGINSVSSGVPYGNTDITSVKQDYVFQTGDDSPRKKLF